MNRIDKLLSLNIENNNIKLILVQINEAHSDEWPKHLQDQPAPQKDFNDRIDRAKLFQEKYNIDQYPFIQVYVDGWDNSVDTMLQLWPDKYYLLDKNKKILKKSEYGSASDSSRKSEAQVIEDYFDILSNISKSDISKSDISINTHK